MSSFYDLSDWDKVRIALLKQERDRLWKQMMNIEQEIHGIYEKAPMKYKMDFTVTKEEFSFNKDAVDKLRYVQLGDDVKPMGAVKIVTGAE